MAIFNLSIKLSFTRSKKTLFIGALLGITSLTIAGLLFFLYQFRNSIYPNVYVDNIEVGGLTKIQALEKITASQNQLSPHIIQVSVDDINIASDSTQLEATKDYTTALNQAYNIGRTGKIDEKITNLIQLAQKPQKLTVKTQYNLDNLQLMIAKLKEKVDIEGSRPSAQLAYSGSPYSLSIDSGADGRELVVESTLDLVLNTLAKSEYGVWGMGNNNLVSESSISAVDEKTTPMIKISALVASTSAELNDEEIEAAKEKAGIFVGKEVTFFATDEKNEDVFVKLNDQEMINLLTFPEGYSDEKLEILLTNWEEKISRPPQDAEFKYNPETLKVESFAPHRDGLTLDVEKTGEQITRLLDEIVSVSTQYQYLVSVSKSASSIGDDGEIPSEMPLALISQPPLVTLAETNNLGINERIGFGDSYYGHSIPTRIHNVALTAKIMNLTIVPPDEEFSFNKTLGEVSQRTGFRPAYVIKDGATILGDGGGVCQVSTTTFRSLLDAGLPITKRKPHSYRVGYYEQNSQPGIDATVYSGDVDLRFVNDTGHHVLIYTETDSDNFYMKVELYGTSDGRTSEIVDYKQWDARPPLETQYIPDPSLPTGKLKQIDWSAPGLKTSFVNVVKDEKGNILREDKYTSNYRPWAAKYLQGV